MEKIFKIGNIEFIKYDHKNENDINELFSIGEKLKNALSNKKMLSLYGEKGDIVILKKNNEVVANTYIKEEKIDFLAEKHNRPVVDEDVLRATLEFSKTLNMSTDEFKKSLARYCTSNSEEAVAIRRQMFDIVDKLEQGEKRRLNHK